jgi:TolB-like protein/DNA-binding winged helix-turn-helix (wHTH) protein/Tfp pilus assembly protein PilF
MSRAAGSTYEFGPFRVDVLARSLLRDGRSVPLTPKSFDVLLALIENSGRVVRKEELMSRLWPDTVVEEHNLTVNISALRKAMNEDSGQRYILTIPGSGYRLAMPVRVVENAPDKSRSTASAIEVARRSWTRSLWIGLGLIVVVAAVGLFRLVRPTVTLRQKSVAVLPFNVLSPTDDDYLGVGIADTLITRLSNVRQIAVRPTSSVLKFHGQVQDAAAAGRELKVDSVLEGTIRRSDGRIRVTVQLVSVADGAPLWAGTFDEKMTDLFTVEDSISERVSSALAVELTQHEKGLLTKRYTGNVEAYELYLKGRYFWNKRTTEGFEKAIEHFQDAIKRDPNYALAYTGLADCYNLARLEQAPKDLNENAVNAVIKALKVDEALPEAHLALANIRFRYDLDWSGAATEFKRALDLDPSSADAHRRYAQYLSYLGRFAEATAEMKRAQQLDPISVVINGMLAQISFFEGRYAEAAHQYKQTLEMDPNFTIAQRELGLVYEQMGAYSDALRELQRSMNLPGNFFKPTNEADIGHLYAVSGNRTEAQKVLEDLKDRGRQSYVPPYDIAIVYAGLGERDATFEWLNKAYEDRSFWLSWLKVDPRLRAVRSDPRYVELDRRVSN